MRISAFVRDDGACGYYRIRLPLDTMADMEYKKVSREFVMPGEPVDIIAEKLDADLVIIPRPNSRTMFDKIQRLKDLGKKVVVDHDDNCFRVSPFSPHYQDFGIEECSYEFEDGKKVDVWVDGKTFNIVHNKEKLRWMEKCFLEADAITTTTPILADVFAQYNKNTFVLPNCVDMSLYKDIRIPKETDELRLGWHGGVSHYEDIHILKDVFPIIMEKYSNLKLVFVGSKWDTLLKGCPKDRFEYNEWVHIEAHPYHMKLLNIDIGLIPLRDTEFNANKSPIKWVEYSALGVPCVMSYVEPYIPVYNGNNAICVENEVDAWVQGISVLVEDTVLRANIAREAKNTVSDKFNIKIQYKRWENLYRGIINGTASGTYSHHARTGSP